MDYYYLIIVTNKKINIPSNLDYCLINKECTLIDECHLKVIDKEIEFSYLIFDYSNLVNYNKLLMEEFEEPITNFFYQTSLDNIYYLNSKITNYQEAINEIIENE